MTIAPKKKLIEVSLPLESINRESTRDKSLRHGHPSTLHLYWSRKPLATARAILFAQLVDDPSARPEEFPTQAEQDRERQRLHALIEELIVWENSNDERVLARAQEEILKSNNDQLPTILDPFTGGGSIPLEAQRLGMDTQASDLNPLSVLINKAQVEIPPKFAAKTPIYPGEMRTEHAWKRAEGLAEDVRKYGEWMRTQAQARIGHLCPNVTARGGTKHTVIAWLWARTVRSPNPANPMMVPLVTSWWLSKRKGSEAWINAEVVGNEIQYTVVNDAHGPDKANDGTVGRARGGAVSIADGTPMSWEYIREQGSTSGFGHELIGVVAEGERGRLYVSPTFDQVEAASVERPESTPQGEIPPGGPSARNVPLYGFESFADLFTNRQLTVLTCLSDLVSEARNKALEDALNHGIPEGEPLSDGGTGASAYADAIAVYLGLAVSRTTDRSSSFATWDSSNPKIRNTLGMQAIPMVWNFAEANALSDSTGSFKSQLDYLCKAIAHLPAKATGMVEQANASARAYDGVVVSTDPPYYDMIGYADLSDFFYIWLRRTLGGIVPTVVETMLTPKSDELVANAYRHNGKVGAEKFFVDGFNQVFSRIRSSASYGPPMVVYYAYKQQKSAVTGEGWTGWHTLLDGLIKSGWEITATWPITTELKNRSKAQTSNSLASSIVLACRPRAHDAATSTRRAFVAALKNELPNSLNILIKSDVAPVDLAQAALGPGISVFSRYSRVREADGSDMSVKDALQLINSTLDDVLGEQESDFDPETRFAVKWYRQYGWAQASSGIADQLARSSDTLIGVLERGGIFEAKGGKARLLSPSELGSQWDVAADEHVSVWEATVRLAALMATGGADKVAELLPSLQTRVNLEEIKELGFLVFHEAEKKKDTKDAILFNGLISAWADVNEQAHEHASALYSFQEEFDFHKGEE